ncbi:MAG: ABC transporter substrate-binding protein [Alphaproteobacteria bacterium]|nr:ABC transporter substrate-binding protein [Alphaproteobacteria bacterium]|tara:strand:- start:103 stop:1029 length:927 start_codon:yes stop_codon:yes gene_type:complete
MRKMIINVFPGAINVPLWSGIEQGFFAKRDLEMEIVYTPNSVEQLTGIAAGKFDIMLTSIDNIIAYKEGQGEVPADGDTDLFAFMGSDDAFLCLAVQEDIESFADLPGKILTADALTTGFAFVLRRMLALNGVDENEIEWMSTGGVLQRWQAMMEHPEQKGTLQVTPFEIMGASRGHHVLARASDVLDAYQGIVGGARVAWAEENADDLSGFIAGWLESVNWMYDPGNRETALDIISENMPQMPREVATGACDVFFDAKTGMRRDGAFDVPGIETVLDLRREFGPAPDDLHGPEHYIDTRYLEAAKGR